MREGPPEGWAGADHDVDAVGLAVEVHPERERVRVQLTGELDLVSRTALHDAVMDLVSVGFGHIVIALHGLSFVDLSGIGSLIALNRRARAEGWKLEMTHAQGQVLRTIILCGADRHLDFIS